MAKWNQSLIAVLAATFLAIPVLGDSPAPPFAHKTVAPGGRFLFVMLAPWRLPDETKWWDEKTIAGFTEIHRKYPKSGMYLNDGSTTPLWTVDWYTDVVSPTSDGVHLIRHGYWPTLRDWEPDLNCEALCFIKSGELIRSYRIGDLIDDPEFLTYSSSRFFWEEEGGLTAEYEYTVTTLDGNRFVFDIRTGEIVSRSKVALKKSNPYSENMESNSPDVHGFWQSWQAALGVAVVALLVWYLWPRHIRQRRAD